jgi:hypothetical protein
MDAGRLVTPESDLRDVRAVGSDLRTGPDGTRVGSLAVDATVPFSVVAEQLGPGTTVEPAADGQASVRRRVSVLGREVELVATGTVEAVGGRLVVRPRTIDVGGPAFVAEAIAAAARELVVIEQDVDGLPEGPGAAAGHRHRQRVPRPAGRAGRPGRTLTDRPAARVRPADVGPR